ncbi:MAG: TrmH family RNA methyltransferase [Exilispira sp.]
MINRENFNKLSKRNQAKKILFLIDNILLNIKINKDYDILRDLNKLAEYLCISGKFDNQLIDLSSFVKYDKPFDFKSLKNFMLKLKEEIIYNFSIIVNETDYINYTKYGNDYKSTKNSIVILDNIRSPFNAGSIIRSAEAFGFKSVILFGISSQLPEKKIYRTSMNAEKLIESIRMDNILNLFDYIDKEGFKIVVLEKNNKSKNLYNTEIGKNIALVVGNEEFGVCEEIMDKAQLILEIPQYGVKNSINVSSAFSIAASWISFKYFN